MEFTQILTPLSSLFSSSPLIKKPSVPLTVMVISPHPDDESIISSLALRLMHENNVHVINVAVTLGSNIERQKERKEELKKACSVLDFENIVLPISWTKKAHELKSLIRKYRPSLIIAPHLKDHHPTHIKTGLLLKKILPLTKSSATLIAWSEFWGQLEKPNLLIEVPQEILELQMEALAQHTGEIKRNPYHLRLPGWMMDNVRRGAELIDGQGGTAPQIAFGVLYHLQLFKAGKFKSVAIEPITLSSFADLAQIFKLILDAASGSKTKVK